MKPSTRAPLLNLQLRVVEQTDTGLPRAAAWKAVSRLLLDCCLLSKIS